MNRRLHQSKAYLYYNTIKEENQYWFAREISPAKKAHTGVQQFEILRKKVENVAADNPTRVCKQTNDISRLHADRDACKGSTDTPLEVQH
jgi:hypothetical protein